jgi:methylenetetrahydrofolate dehydrogenase (NADP+)/methenyltetrahydrofolate cyclohydrolase
MSIIMKGSAVAAAMKEQIHKELAGLRLQGVIPGLAIVRVGVRPDDLAYERSAVKKLEGLGIKCRVAAYPENISQPEFIKEFTSVNEDPAIHGVLLFRPLPKHLDETAVKLVIDPHKDLDCLSPVNIAKVFSGDETGFAPCTPEAVIKVLHYYGITLSGKRVTVVGRSMVVGKPLAMLLVKENATVTICHTKTKNLAETCRNAEIVIAAAGKTKMITAGFVCAHSVVLDVGINVDAAGNLCGDVDYEQVAPLVAAITPVPGGVGTVTALVLGEHVIRAARDAQKSLIDYRDGVKA